jgi:uncharacterized membrane protein
MTPDRLNALTDGVVAIVLTIMVLELKFPEEPSLGAVLTVLPLLAAYLLAFIYVAIYWNNHHHMVDSAQKVTGAVLWTNHALLFCLTLFPLMIRWIGEAGVTTLPVASFGIVLALAALAYRFLQFALAAAEGEGSRIDEVMRRPLKEYSSLACYVVAIVVAFFQPYISVGIYVLVATVWVIPDRRFARPAA